MIEAQAHDLHLISRHHKSSSSCDRGDSVEMVAIGCPVNGFAQAFLKLDVVQVHGWANADGVISKSQYVPNPNANLSYGLVRDKKGIKSEVENTWTFGCFLNAFSLDQIGKSNLSANAKYFSTSSNSFSGPTGLNLPENSNSWTTPSVMKAAKTLLASTTIDRDAIHISPFSLSSANISSFAFLPSFIASSSANLLPEISALNKACRNLRDLSSFNSNALNSIAFSATSDQSSSCNSSISFSNSFGILITNSPISIIANNIGIEYLNNFCSLGDHAAASAELLRRAEFSDAEPTEHLFRYLRLLFFSRSLFLNLLSQLEQLFSRANLCNLVVTKGVTYKKSYFLFRKKTKIILLSLT
jgi:hypothetical protein